MIKNIIFDLGAVILAIDLNVFVQELRKLAPKADFVFDQKRQTFFTDFEKGLISDNTFFEQLQLTLGSKVPTEDLRIAWNKILLKPYKESFAFLKWAISKYSLFLLSNTNSAHRQQFDDIFNKEWGLGVFYTFFKRIYYSYEMQLIKPSKDIFIQVLENTEILANETLFIDDNSDNIVAAQKLGLHTWHFTEVDDWLPIKQFLHERKDNMPF